MGMPSYEKIEISERLSEIVFNANQDLELGLDIQNRIEMSQLESQEMLAIYDMKNNKVQYMPNMDLYLSWGLNAGVKQFKELGDLGNRRVWPDYQMAGIKLYVPIFDGLLKSKKIQQTKLKLRQITYQRMKLENSINLEAKQARYNLLSQIEQLENQKENMKLAREVYEDTKLKYQEGMGSNLAVIEADNAFKTAQTNYFTALYEALLAKVDYEKALGILLDTTKQ
jgi:outer membrane protein TolC